MRISDWSSDVCSSDLTVIGGASSAIAPFAVARWSNYPAWYGRRADGGAETIGSGARPDGIALFAARHEKQEQCHLSRVVSLPTTGHLQRGEWSWSNPPRNRPAHSRAASRKANTSHTRPEKSR